MQEARKSQRLVPPTLSSRVQVQEAKAVKKLLSVSASDKVWNPEQRVHHPDELHKILSQAWDDVTEPG